MQPAYPSTDPVNNPDLNNFKVLSIVEDDAFIMKSQ